MGLMNALNMRFLANVIDPSIEPPVETTEPVAEGATAGGWSFVRPEWLTNQILYCALAVVVILLIAVIVMIVIKKKSKNKTTIKEAPAPEEVSSPTIAAPAPVARERILASFHQDIGAREDQQDSYGVSAPSAYEQQGVMAVVADGMGGLSNGSAVSNALVRCFLDGFRVTAGRYTNAADMLLEQTVRANAYINQMLRGAERSGSTLLCVVVRNGFLNFLTVGDSRIYLYRSGALIQLNREHIYQEELAVKAVNQGINLQQVRSDRQAHALTSYLGIGKIPYIDRNDEPLKLLNGDRIMLASDGVFGTLSAAQMEEALKHDIKESAVMIGDMIRKANRTYQDNNTAVILEYRE